MKKNRVILGVALPFFLSLMIGVLIQFGFRSVSVKQGVYLGMTLAFIQSLLSMGALAWAWKKASFYWVWGGGMLFRLFVFAGTAFIVYRYTTVNLISVLLTLAVATMVFLVTEALLFFGQT